VSDITREARGGILRGRLLLPSAPSPLFVRLSLVPAAVSSNNSPLHFLHPNLLHINMRTNRKIRKLQVRIHVY
jgi:hypothetical protein